MSAHAPTLRQDVKLIGLISVSHGLSHFFQLVIAVLFPLIRADLGVSYAQLGAVMALYFTVSALSQTLAGFVVDRFGPMRVLYGGLVLCSLGILVAGWAPNYYFLFLAAALAGAGNSVFHPVDFSILNARVAPARLGPAYSVHGFLGAVGWALAPLFSYGLSALYGWRMALVAAAALGGIMIAALWLGGVASGQGAPGKAVPRERSTLRGDVGVLLQLPVVLCFLYFVLTAAALTGIQTFGVSTLVAMYSAPVGVASSALTAYLFASGLGILGGGYLAARFRREDIVAALGVFCAALATLVLALGVVPISGLAPLLGAAGFLYGLSSASRDLLVKGATPPGATGKVYGFVYSGIDVGQMVMPVFFGWMLDHGHPEAVFYATFVALALAVFTVLRLPSRERLRKARPLAAGG